MTRRGFIVDFGHVELSVSDVWPDGDAPENPTAADVAAVMDRYGAWRVINDWCLLPDGFDVIDPAGARARVR